MQRDNVKVNWASCELQIYAGCLTRHKGRNIQKVISGRYLSGVFIRWKCTAIQKTVQIIIKLPSLQINISCDDECGVGETCWIDSRMLSPLWLQDILALQMLDCQQNHNVSIPKVPCGTKLTVWTKWCLQQMRKYSYLDNCTHHHQAS